MSVNIYDGTSLTPIAGKTVPAPTPDYVDEQFNPSTTYSKGMTCIEGNVRYCYKNSTATSGRRPPDTTYWEVLSVASELNNNWVKIAEINTTNFNYSSTGNYKGARKSITSIADLNQYTELMLVVYRSSETKIKGSTIIPTSAISDFNSDYQIGFVAPVDQNSTKTYWVYFERSNTSYYFDFLDFSEGITLAKAILYAR